MSGTHLDGVGEVVVEVAVHDRPGARAVVVVGVADVEVVREYDVHLAKRDRDGQDTSHSRVKLRASLR